ncbi:MAG: pyridoxamine 5'-phosphate oxidase [Planctomycetota bacterium]|nr:pyridoxamine 5'-phosphate oxidase [Planctomycetota bacterium]
MNPSDSFEPEELLPEALPEEPWWFFTAAWREAHDRRLQPNPNCFTLATIDPDGRPSARIVLCKDMNLAPDAGYIVFHTNRQGRKGRALAANPRAAAVFHWDDLDKQVRIEGPVVHSPDAESDAYFDSRPLERRIGAWASNQSQPLDSRETLVMQAMEVMQRFGVSLDDQDARIPRPPHWGGFRLWAEAVELWVGAPGRLHERARWTRALQPHQTPQGPSFRPGSWSRTRLQP